MSDLSQYQTDHLLLLVGTNPLPDFVAASLLAKDDATVHLLHSSDTATVSTRLEIVINNRRPQVKTVRREIDAANAVRICQELGKILEEIPKQDSIGLNYTGGTKAMAVHAYQAVKHRLTVSSYLDARTLSLMIDTPRQSPIPARQSCKLSLRELVELHGRQMNEPEKETILDGHVSDGIDFPSLVKALLSIHTGNSANKWRDWCRDLKKPNNGDWQSKTKLGQLSLPHDDDLFRPIVAALGGRKTLGEIPLPKHWGVDKLAEFLDGKWLEHYVMHCLKGVAAHCQVHDWGMSLQTTDSAGQQFEFDVAAMLGYQLFAVSCTTESRRGSCKLKLFEAYVRARQLGGDEARVALVCCNRDPKSLKQQIEEEWFTEGRIRIFGQPELARELGSELRVWLEAINF